MSSNKMDASEVFAMFETINSKLDKQPNKQVEPVPIDLSPINAMTEQLESIIAEVQKPTKVEHQHRHTIDIGSSKVFLSLIIMALLIIGLSYVVGEQRRSINQYKDNDLKYRFIKMHGQSNEESLFQLERQFRYTDSIKIIHRQVEKYEELVKEQAERIKRAKQDSEEVEKLQKEKDSIKNAKKSF